MFHGGTNFGFMNGANEETENDQLKNGRDYMADVTSYGTSWEWVWVYVYTGLSSQFHFQGAEAEFGQVYQLADDFHPDYFDSNFAHYSLCSNLW